jgi:hypothetical protein
MDEGIEQRCVWVGRLAEACCPSIRIMQGIATPSASEWHLIHEKRWKHCAFHIRSLCIALVLYMPLLIVVTCDLLDRLTWIDPVQGVLVQVIWLH